MSRTETLKRTNILKDATSQPAVPVVSHDAPPEPEIDHHEKLQCEKGHCQWRRIGKAIWKVYSMDHRAYVLHCDECQEDYILPAGSFRPIGAGVDGAGV